MRTGPLLFLSGLAMLAVRPAPCGNQALVSGAYAATLGAGGATAAERCALGQNPAALRPGRLGAHLDFNRPYGMDEIQVAEAGGFLDASHWGVSADWRQTGVAGLYAEHGFQVTQTLRLGSPGRPGEGGAHFPGVLDLGAAWNGWRAEWPGGNAEMSWTHGLGLAWRPFPRLKAGAFALGLPLDQYWETEGEAAATGRSFTDRILQWGLEADSRDPEAETGRSGPCQILRLDFRKTGETPWRTLVSLSLSHRSGLEITGGFAAPPFQASLGVRAAWAGWEVRQALRYHRYLGRTWLSGLSFSRATGATPHN